MAGEDGGLSAAGAISNPGRDSTALTVVEVDLSSVADELIRKPTYRVQARRMWTGVKHSRLYGEIKALAELWRARYLVVDATGVGAGLASFLEKALPGKVIPFVFNSSSKSKLGWDFLGIVDSGRWKEYQATGIRSQVSEKSDQESGPRITTVDSCLSPVSCDLSPLFFRQLELCQYEVIPGPEKRMKWGVPDGTRDPATGELVHDDLLLSAALAAELDRLEWDAAGPALVVRAKDPLGEMDARKW